MNVPAMLERLGDDFDVFSDRADDAIEREALLDALAGFTSARPERADLH